ncbi:unnamed protein product, partial [marine sediment metagenome]
MTVVIDIDKAVAASSDDAGEFDQTPFSPDFDMDLTLTDFNFDYYKERSGYRWDNVTIPVGVTITNAYIDFAFAGTGDAASDPEHELWFEDNINPLTFTTADMNISDRTVTSTQLTLGDHSILGATPGDWWSEIATPPDISSIIQELVDSYDYSG